MSVSSVRLLVRAKFSLSVSSERPERPVTLSANTALAACCTSRGPMLPKLFR